MNGIMVWLTKALGLAPPAPKTGAREAVVFSLLFVITMTVLIVAAALYWNNPEFLLHGSPLILGLWIPTMSLVAYVYKMKSETIQQATPSSSPDTMGGGYDPYASDPGTL